MLPDRVSNPGPLTYESGALPIALRGPAMVIERLSHVCIVLTRFLWQSRKRGITLPYKVRPKKKICVRLFFVLVHN